MEVSTREPFGRYTRSSRHVVTPSSNVQLMKNKIKRINANWMPKLFSYVINKTKILNNNARPTANTDDNPYRSPLKFTIIWHEVLEKFSERQCNIAQLPHHYTARTVFNPSYLGVGYITPTKHLTPNFTSLVSLKLNLRKYEKFN